MSYRRIWRKVEDKDVQHVWRCDQCRTTRHWIQTIVSPSWYENKGIPVCYRCDEEMEYVHTEVRS
jgi:hypothetical protein